MNIFKKLFFLLSPSRKKQLLILAGFLLIGIFFEMLGLGILIPALGLLLNSNIVQDYPSLQPIIKILGNPTQTQLALWGMSLLVIIYFIKTLFLIFLSWRQSKFSVELSEELARKLFLGYLKQPYTFHLERNSAQLISNIQTEISQFSSVSQSVIFMSLELSVVVGIAFTLVLIEPTGAFVVTFFITLSAFGFHRLTRQKLVHWGERRQFHDAQINQHLMQGLGGVKDVKLMGRESYFSSIYNYHYAKRSGIYTKQVTLMQVPRLYMEFLAVLGLAGLVIVMILQNKSLNLLLPILGVFMAAAFRILPSVNRIMAAIQNIRFSKPVVDQLYKEFKIIIENNTTEQSFSKVNFNSTIEIKNLNFHYPNTSTNSLDGVSFIINKGESVGFIGISGSGKSTLADVILGLLTPQEGEICVDNTNIQDSLRGWQNQIGYVPQTIYLTDDSLSRNVAFGIAPEDIDMEAVTRAIKAAQLDEFVNNLPHGLETFVGERGVRLSGGQRQRIGIARALYHDPSVLILDEATSALDSATEKSVMRAVNALHGKKTLLIVAHRLSTVENCDRLYRLEKGKIIQEGTPETILNAGNYT